MAHSNHMKLLAYEYCRLMLATPQWPGHPLFLRAAYRTLLNREPDEAGYQHYLHGLRQKHISRRDVLVYIMESKEYQRLQRGITRPLDALHISRTILFQAHLPPAQTIVDLGGAATFTDEGALLAMGYPHHPREITIVDLPPETRLDRAAEESQELIVRGDIRIRYLYRSMADLSPIADASVGLVVSGESIEHITEEEADTVCREVYRILQPGGFFCLDTPNAALTRIQSPDQLIHPEHKKEYLVHELAAKLDRWGFEILEARGICPMPQSRHTGVFDFEEMLDNIGLCDDPEMGYMFFLKAVKSIGTQTGN